MYKLLQINSTQNYGSTGRIAENIGILANENGFDTYMVHGPRCVNPSALKSICTESSFEEKVHGVMSRLFDAHGLASVCATRKLIRKFKEIKPDIIHLHNIHGYYINYPILFEYLKEVQKPVVWTLHDIWVFTGHCSYFELDCHNWQSDCHNCKLKHSYPKSYTDFSHRNYYLKKKVFNGLDNMILVPVSEWLDGLLKQSFLKDYKTKVIHNGIDISVFNLKDDSSEIKQKYGITGRKVIIGVASPFTSKKGFDDFIKLRQMLPDEYQIILVGLTEGQIYGLPYGITGIARTQNIQELSSLYSSADVFVNLTYADNFPTTNLEALACGTPVVTYRTGGSPEAVDEYTGIVVGKGDLSAAKDAVISICEKGKAYYSGKCRSRAERHFNKNNSFRKYIDLYQELLSEIS